MKKEFLVFLILLFFIFFVYQPAFLNFFAQDDFILINQFSQNNIWQDLKNVFGPPQVTHWRPIHNLYFFVAGNLFSENYAGYHALTFAFHIGASFLIYKTAFRLFKNQVASLSSGILYGVHPAHFISLFWISGGATSIGFFFLIASFYGYLTGKRSFSLILFLLAILASEAMMVGLGIILLWEILTKGKKLDKRFLVEIGVISTVFAVVRFLTFTPKTAFDVYNLEFSTLIISTVKYYLLRIAGFAEVSGDKIISIFLLSWLVLISLLLIKTLSKKQDIRLLILSVAVITIGLFPFILIPSHLSPHYMNLSIFGFSTLVSCALKQLKPLTSFTIILIFVVISASNINQTLNNNWVIRRGNLAKAYIEQIEKDNPASGATLTFEDSSLSTSREAYISLGTGKGIKFWFKDRNYKTCFSAFEKCAILN